MPASDTEVRETAAVVRELAALPRRFEQFVGETRDAFSVLSTQVMPFILKLDAKLDDIYERIRALEQRQHNTTGKVLELERGNLARDERIGALETRVPVPARVLPLKRTGTKGRR